MPIKKVSRRDALGLLGLGGAAISLGCGSDSSASPTAITGTTTTGGSNTSGACAVTPTETVGPYPSLTNFVRSDIREGKSGLPLALTITVVNASAGRAMRRGRQSTPGLSDTAAHRRASRPDAVKTHLNLPGWHQGHVEVKVTGLPSGH